MKARGSGGAAASVVHDNVVNQLLTKLDGMQSLDNVLVVGITNRRDLLDPAVLRPGRLELQVEVGLPDERGRRQIFNIHTAAMRTGGMLAADVDVDALAATTGNYSGAEIKGLVGAAQLLERQLKEPALHEYTAVIIAEADRLAALVDALLGPGQPPRKEPVNIHEIVQHVGHLLAAEAPTGVQIERDYDPSLPRLRLDRNQIIQALLNLGRNAIQAVGERGRITLRTRALTNASILI